MSPAPYTEEPHPHGSTTKLAASKTSDSADNAFATNAAVSTEAVSDELSKQQRGLRFWMCIVALMVSSFLMVLDLVRKHSVVYTRAAPHGCAAVWSWDGTSGYRRRSPWQGVRVGWLCIRSLGDRLSAA